MRLPLPGKDREVTKSQNNNLSYWALLNPRLLVSKADIPVIAMGSVDKWITQYLNYASITANLIFGADYLIALRSDALAQEVIAALWRNRPKQYKRIDLSFCK